AELFGRALVGTTARAEDAIWDVVRAMVTPHQLPPGCGQGPSKQPKGYPQRAGFWTRVSGFGLGAGAGLGRLGGDPAPDPVEGSVARVLVEVALVVLLRPPEAIDGDDLGHYRALEVGLGSPLRAVCLGFLVGVVKEEDRT